jgi:hypothetical protein
VMRTLKLNGLSAPKLSRRFATIDANRRSPAKSEIRKIYSGALA